jgi:hypothetical protein
MAAFRLPGPVRVMTLAGTSGRTGRAPPGLLGGCVEGPRLSEYELDYIDRVVGRNRDRTPFPLARLGAEHHRNTLLYEQTVRESGIHSPSAAFLHATVEQLNKMIEEARSPRGRAAENLRKLLEPPEGTDDQILDACGDLRAAEQEVRVRRLPDTTGLTQPERVAAWLSHPDIDDPISLQVSELLDRALRFICRRRIADAQNVYDTAKYHGSMILDVQLLDARERLMNVERVTEIHGAADGTLAERTALAGKITDLLYQRKVAAVKNLVEKAKRGSKVTAADVAPLMTQLISLQLYQDTVGDGHGGLTFRAVISELASIPTE